MMSEENKDNLTEAAENAVEQVEETVQDAAESVEDAVAEVTESVEESVEGVQETVADAASDATETLQESEEVIEDLAAGATPNEVALASQDALTDDAPVTPLPVAEDPVGETDTSHATGDHHYSDTVVLPIINRTVTVNGGIYTVIFAVLAAITVIEVISAELFPDGPLRVGLLLGLSVAKALMVIYFYMHLQSDNRLFRLVLGLPMLIVIVSLLFLIIARLPLGYPGSPV
ncbi:MAG: cytochrome C oxidase subunit IV family protein [Aggregatilineales bacterium]